MTKMHAYILCFSHNIYHQHVSTAVATIFRVTYRNTRNANNLSKHISEPLCIPNILLSYPKDGWDEDLNTLVIKIVRPLKMGKIGCSRTSVRNYHCSLHNNPDESSSHLLHGKCQKSHKHNPST
jgi:hypothetical protein